MSGGTEGKTMPGAEISVIVPVYNAEAYLFDTLESLSRQSFRSFEAILVDDGSTDGSAGVIDAYCAGDERFRALHVPHGGVYRARLRGIGAARGRYIAFCDSDDLYLPDMLEKLYARAEESGADVTVCGFLREEMETGRVLSREMCAFEARACAFPELWDILPAVNSALWNKLFRAELLSEPLRLERPPRVGEDMLLLTALYPRVRRMAFVPEALYRYRVRSGSALSHIDAADVALAREGMLLACGDALRRDGGAEMRAYLDTLAFIHFGWAMVIRQTRGAGPSRAVVRDARRWLAQHFPGYKRAGRTLGWNLRHHMRQFTTLVGRLIFCAHLMGPFLVFYEIVTQRLKKEIKW